jgi:hypothetical protein
MGACIHSFNANEVKGIHLFTDRKVEGTHILSLATKLNWIHSLAKKDIHSFIGHEVEGTHSFINHEIEGIHSFTCYEVESILSVSGHTAKTKCRKLETNIPRKGLSGSQSQFPHSCVCERIIYSHDGSAFSAGGNMWTDPGKI